MSDQDESDRLKSLGERLNKMRQIRKDAAPVEDEDRGFLQVALGLGFRIGIEMVVALGVGLGIGWVIDRALGTRPWLTIIFLVLGLAAGVFNVFRAVNGQGYAVGWRKPDDDQGK